MKKVNLFIRAIPLLFVITAIYYILIKLIGGAKTTVLLTLLISGLYYHRK